MPQFTEERIQKLCSEAVAVTNEQDIEQVMTQLRSALEEHVRLAKNSLTAQASTISMLDTKEGRLTAEKPSPVA